MSFATIRWWPAASILVLAALSFVGRATADEAPWNFGNGGQPISQPMVLSALQNSGPSIAALPGGNSISALMTYYINDLDSNPGLLYSLETGENDGSDSWTPPAILPLDTNSGPPAIPQSGAGVCQTQNGVVAAWSSSVSQSDYYVYNSYQNGWKPQSTACPAQSSPASAIQPATAWSAATPDLVNIYTQGQQPVQLYAADQVKYDEPLACVQSAPLQNAPPPSGTGAAFEVIENLYYVFTCSNGFVAWVADGGTRYVSDLRCASDTTIAAVFVSSIPSTTYSGIVFFYKFEGSVYYGYRVSNSGTVYPSGAVTQGLGYGTNLAMPGWVGGPGAVFFPNTQSMLVVYQGDQSGMIYRGWGTPVEQ